MVLALMPLSSKTNVGFCVAGFEIVTIPASATVDSKVVGLVEGVPKVPQQELSARSIIGQEGSAGYIAPNVKAAGSSLKVQVKFGMV